jgi:hypothetical protein
MNEARDSRVGGTDLRHTLKAKAWLSLLGLLTTTAEQ